MRLNLNDNIGVSEARTIIEAMKIAEVCKECCDRLEKGEKKHE